MEKEFKNILPESISLKDININTNSETGGFSLININIKEINRIINLLLKRVIELGEEQDIDNIINNIISTIAKSKKKFKLPFELTTIDLPLIFEHQNERFEVIREDELTFSISRIENDSIAEWDTSALISQVKTSDGIAINCSIITKKPNILIQFSSRPDEDHWLYII